MKNIYYLTLLLSIASIQHLVGEESIRIVTSIPDLADIAKNIGGDRVSVQSIATGVEDPHGIPIKPSHAAKLNKADLVIVLGMGNEHAYFPALLEASRNNRIKPGKQAYIDTSEGVIPLEIPSTLDRSEGENHPQGNPHYNLDPVYGRTIATNIYKGLVQNFPQHEEEFKKNLEEYLQKLDDKIEEWTRAATVLKGQKFVSYHRNWPYFAKRFGLEHAGTVEFKSGVEPTSRHIKQLVEMMKKDDVKILISEPQFSDKVPRQVAADTGAKLLKLPIMAGGVSQAKSYIDMIDYNVRSLVDAVKGSQEY